jgi:hypothetical protein
VGSEVRRRVLLRLAARDVVAEVEVAVPPQALGHEEVVRLVARDAEASRVVDADPGEEEEADSEENRGRHRPAKEGPETIARFARDRREYREHREHDTERAAEDVEDGKRGGERGDVRGRQDRACGEERTKTDRKTPHARGMLPRAEVGGQSAAGVLPAATGCRAAAQVMGTLCSRQ